jgi:hypothetical protein
MSRTVGGLSSKELSKFVKASYKKKSDANTVDGYTLDKELSTKRSKVYVDPQSGKTVVTHAGTDSSSDWIHNALVPVPALYTKQDRYKRAEKVQKQANKKYGKENITTVSHSQSGAIAKELARKGLSDASVSLNPAIIGQHEGVQVVRSTGDVVSALTSIGEKDFELGDKTFNPLAEHGTTILSRDPRDYVGGCCCGEMMMARPRGMMFVEDRI